MDDSRLPVELYEHIIYASIGRNKWCYTALVCASWLPRSRFHLYHEVFLWSPKEVKLLLHTLQESSHLASLVVKLRVSGERYLQFVQLACLLKNCSILDLTCIDWREYPPRFADTCLYHFSSLGIVEFHVSVTRPTALGLLRFIRSLTKLEKLTLAEDVDEEEPVPALSPWRSHVGKAAGLSKLKKLRLRWDILTIKFPLHYFGEAVVDLHLDFSGDGISDEMLQCIRNFQQLRKLSISLGPLCNQHDTYDPQSPMSSISMLFSTLRNVSSGSALHFLSIDWSPIGIFDWERRYLIECSGLLDILVGEHMLAVLNGFTSLTQLHFKLCDNDAEYDEVWWKEEIIRRLPSRLHAAVSVTIWLRETWPNLWLTEDDATDKDAEDETTKEEVEDIVTNDLAISSSTSHPQFDSAMVNNGGNRRNTFRGWSTYKRNWDKPSYPLSTMQLYS